MQAEQPVHILLVDDRPENLLTLESLLSELGHQLVTARSGVEALRCLLKQDFALILLDVQMPELDGFETAKLIRSRARSQHTPIIFLTALDRSDINVFQGYSVGAVDVMFKPFVPEILRYKVSVFVDLYKKTMQVQQYAQQLEARVEQRTQELTAVNRTLREEISERKRIEQALRFILDSSTSLSSSLELHSILEHIVQLSVPDIADLCAVEIFESEHDPGQSRLTHVQPDQETALQYLETHGSLFDLVKQAAQASFGYHESVLFTQLDAQAVNQASGEQHVWATFARLGLTSVVCVSLIVREQHVGRIVLCYGPSQRVYEQTDLPLVHELGQRASLALEHAWLYEDVQQALKARDQFLSVASHELKTPITTVLGYAQLLERRLKREAQENPRNLKALSTLVEQCQRLDRLIRALLDLSRIQMGQFTLEYAEFDIAQFVQRIVEESQPLVQHHTLSFHLDIQQEQITLQGDELRLAQVFQNLIQNAVKYSAHGGTVDVTLSQQPTGVLVSVRDEGLGIPAEAIPQLFNRFYRASNIEPDVSGMGLGLYVVREIVSLHHGTISVDSVEGQGSTFSVFLPFIHEPRLLSAGAPQPEDNAA